MTRALPRTNFHSSALIRRLADLGIAEAMNPGSAFAERLGEWIHFTDAIALSAVHGDGLAGSPKTAGSGGGTGPDELDAAFRRIQAGLADSIAKSCSPKPGRTHVKLPEPILELPLDLAMAYPPYRRFYEAHQRDMELGIQPLRVNVRDAVAKASPRLRKLAELDAMFEKILRDREARLLARIPQLLRRHFEQLFRSHRQKLADADQEDNPAGWIKTGGWLAHFCNDMQALLQAELEFRLQPTLGLIEAYRQDTQ